MGCYDLGDGTLDHLICAARDLGLEAVDWRPGLAPLLELPPDWL